MSRLGGAIVIRAVQAGMSSRHAIAAQADDAVDLAERLTAGLASAEGVPGARASTARTVDALARRTSHLADAMQGDAHLGATRSRLQQAAGAFTGAAETMRGRHGTFAPLESTDHRHALMALHGARAAVRLLHEHPGVPAEAASSTRQFDRLLDAAATTGDPVLVGRLATIEALFPDPGRAQAVARDGHVPRLLGLEADAASRNLETGAGMDQVVAELRDLQLLRSVAPDGLPAAGVGGPIDAGAVQESVLSRLAALEGRDPPSLAEFERHQVAALRGWVGHRAGIDDVLGAPARADAALAAAARARELVGLNMGWAGPEASRMRDAVRDVAATLRALRDTVQARRPADIATAAVLDEATVDLHRWAGLFAGVAAATDGSGAVWKHADLRTALDGAEAAAGSARRALGVSELAAVAGVPASTPNSGALDAATERLVDVVRQYDVDYPWGAADRGIAGKLTDAARGLLEGRRALVARGLDDTGIAARLAADAEVLAEHGGTFGMVESLTSGRSVPLSRRPIKDAVATAHRDARAGSDLLIAAGLRPERLPGVDAQLRQGRLLRSRDPAELDATERLLSTGRSVEGTAGHIQSAARNNINGALDTLDVSDGTHQIGVVRKGLSAQAPQEWFGWQVARLTGIDHLYPVVGRRADGAAFIERVGGAEFGKAGVNSKADLRGALSAWYRQHGSDLPAGEQAKWARIDYQLSQFADYLLANNDRHTGNGLYDRAAGELHMIDFGHIGRGHKDAPLAPNMRRTFMQGRGNHVTLDAETLRLIRERVTPDALRMLHREAFVRAKVDTHSEALQFWRSDRSLRGVLARLDHVQSTGGFHYRTYRS